MGSEGEYTSYSTYINEAQHFEENDCEDAPISPESEDFVMGSQKYIVSENISSSSKLGKKTITYPGSIVLIINNISGPGMLGIPLLFQQAGWLPTITCLIMIWFISTYSASALLEAISIIPGNSHFHERVEFATAIRHFFGMIAYWLTQIFYNLSLETINIASIVVTSQAIDGLFVFVMGKSWALELIPHFGIITQTSSNSTPFINEGEVIISLGYVVCMVCFMPLGFMNLDENIVFQYISFTFLVSLLMEFMLQYLSTGLTFCAVPMIGENISTVLGTVIFSFTFVVTIPSWCNEKKENVSVNKVLWTGTSISTIFYIFFGLFGAWAYPAMTAGNILDVIPYDNCTWPITQLCVYAFSIGVIGLGIPMYSIVIRYNLFVGGVCGVRWSSFWGAVSPWLISWLLYQGNGLTEFVNWTSLFLNGFINFSIPFALFLQAKRVSKALKKVNNNITYPAPVVNSINTSSDENEYLSKEKEKLLMALNSRKDKMTGWVRHFAFPHFIENNDKLLFAVTVIIFSFITLLILISIGIDLFYLIFLHEDILSGDVQSYLDPDCIVTSCQ